MFSSLRVRLPLLFLAGILLSGVVTTAIAVRLFQEFAHDQSVSELRQEASGIAKLYSAAIRDTFAATNKNDSRRAPTFAAQNLELATGDKIYYAGVNPFPGEKSGLRQLDLNSIDWSSGDSLAFEFTPPGAKQEHLAVAEPVILDKRPIGAIVVAKVKTDVNHRVYALMRRLAIAGALGLLVAGALAVYFSRRIVRPVRALSDAADEVAKGNYQVRVPQRAAGEIGHLAERFEQMAERLAERRDIGLHGLAAILLDEG